MLHPIDNGIIFAYLALMIAIGLYASRRQNSVEEFFVAGGKLGTFSIACLWLASWVGGAAIVGGTAKTYEFGISGGWYIACMVIGCLLFGLFFATRVKRSGNEHGLLTYPDLIEIRYDSRTRIVATLTTIIAYVGFSAGQLAAAGAILSNLLGWDFSSSLLLASSIIVAYTATGGYLAVAYTDYVQFTLLFVGIVIVGIPVAVLHGGTPAALVTQLPAAHFNPTNWGVATMLALGISMPMSFFVSMDNFTRIFAARDEVVAKRGTLIAAIFLVPLAIGSVWLGLTAALLYPGVENSGDILSRLVMDIFPVGLKGLMLVGILAALMSTADICILTAAANGSRDIYQRYVNPDVEPQKLFRISMILAAAVGVASALMAWRMQDVVNILLIAFTINGATLFVPTIAMLYMKKVNSVAAFWSIALALPTVIAWYAASAMNIAPIFDLDPLWPGLLVSIVSFFGISLTTSRTELREHDKVRRYDS
ncbi:MAG: sodium:solute symporter family protein [Gammaproteobacteria bacterium]|nr:sodium:solute symporter family protein [Gammaproteobacteria bacterium]